MTDSLGQWPSAPLVYVLAEVRFSPTLDISRRAAVLQDALRAEFPLLEPIAEIRVSPAAPVGSAASTMYAFTDATKRRGVLVSTMSVCYHATAYETSKEFFEQLGRVLTAIEPVYASDTVTRLGLRYVDVIVAELGESVFDYITPAIAGVALNEDDQRRVQCVIEQPRPNGGIAVRLLSLGVPLYRSPDLPAPGLVPPTWVQRAAERKTPTALLDTDNWILGERAFDVKSVLEAFGGLKEGISDAFLKVATPHAIKVWKSDRRNS
jgi:uncharacterized protein (TIGR04255 family)